MSRVPSQTQSSRSYHYGHHPMVTSPGTRSAHLTGRFFPPQQAREHVTDQRLTTPGLIAKPWVPGNNDPLNSTNRAEHAWRGFPTDGTGYNQSARPLPPRPASQFSGVSTHAAEFRHVQPVDPPGMRVHAVQQPRIPAYQPAEPVRESVARSTYVAHTLPPVSSPPPPMARSASRVECRSTQRDLFTAHPIDYPPPKRIGPSPPTSKDNTLYIERHHAASTPQLPSPSSLSHHHHHQRAAAAEPPRMQSMSASAYVAYPPAPASPPPQRAARHSAPFSPMMSASREAYPAWPQQQQQPRGQASFQSVTLPPAPTASE